MGAGLSNALKNFNLKLSNIETIVFATSFDLEYQKFLFKAFESKHIPIL